MTPDERRVAYDADITYGTNNEFGFDYLRDNMAHSLDELVQRGHNFAIVDEVDSILIDEARTPLIISGPADGASNWYAEFARIAPLMEKDTHYEVDIRKRTDRRARGRRGVRRGPARHRQPLRGGQLAAGQLPQQRAQGQGAVRSATRTTSSATAKC